MKSRVVVKKTEVVSETGMVTAMHPLAADAGARILKQGGNAADAAVATAFAVGVVEPFMSGLGGGASIVVHEAATGRTKVIDGYPVIPHAAKEDMFELLDPPIRGSGIYGWKATRNDASETGYRSVAIPGAVAAYVRLLEDFGTMSLKQVLEPAIELASEGFLIDWYVFFTCSSSMSRLKPFPETVNVFYRPDGTPLQAVNYDDTRSSDRLIQLDLASTLKAIVDNGADGFYKGAVAQAIVSHIQSHGGIITEKDMADYETRIFDPLIVNYRGKEIHFAPVNSGGTTVAEMLNILENFDLSSYGHNTTQSLHLLAEAIGMGFADRFVHMGDPDFSPIPIEGLESKAYAATRASQIRQAKCHLSQVAGDPWPFNPGGKPAIPPLPGSGDAANQNTTHLSVIDGDRNMVSLTASLGRAFGSGVAVPGTGVTLNNGMMWFDPTPGHVNSIQPGKRVMHAGTPALALDNNGPLMTVGAPGGRKVLTAVLQSIINVLDFGMGMQDAISAPRIHVETGLLTVDYRIPTDVTEKLIQMGHNIEPREETYISSYFGRPNGILVDSKNGLLRSGLEPTKLSTAVGV